MSLYRSYEENSIIVMLCLKTHNILPEIIHIIISLYYNTRSTPVIMLFMSSICIHSYNLYAKWDFIFDKMLTICPGLRFHKIIDYINNIPILQRYIGWTPNIILSPGPSYDVLKFNDHRGMQVFNGRFDGDRIDYYKQYDILNPNSYIEWFINSLNNKDFLEIQNTQFK